MLLTEITSEGSEKGGDFGRGDSSLCILAMLGFACFTEVGLTLIFSPSMPLLSFFGFDAAVGLRILSVLFLASGYVVFSKNTNWFLERRSWMLAVGFFSIFAVVINAIFGAVLDVFSIYIAAALWLLLGFGEACISSVWNLIFSSLPSKATPVAITSGVLFGTLMYVVVNSSSSVWISVGSQALIAAVSSGVAAYLLSKLFAADFPKGKEWRDLPPSSPRKIASVAAHGAVYGFVVIEICSMGYTAALVGGASGIVGVLLAFVWPLLGSRVDVDAGVIQRISLPLLVISLLLVPFCEGSMRLVFACLANVALAHATTFSLYTIATESHEFQLHPVTEFAKNQAPSQIGFFMGSALALWAFCFADLSERGFCVLVACLVIGVVIVFSVYAGNEESSRVRLGRLLTMERDEGPRSEEQVDSSAHVDDVGQEKFKERCGEIAETYSLTPREAEVFELLGKGRNAAFIAACLGVSSSTAKSHIYHIYQKMGINSQQRLLDVLDAMEARSL